MAFGAAAFSVAFAGYPCSQAQLGLCSRHLVLPCLRHDAGAVERTEAQNLAGIEPLEVELPVLVTRPRRLSTENLAPRFSPPRNGRFAVLDPICSASLKLRLACLLCNTV